MLQISRAWIMRKLSRQASKPPGATAFMAGLGKVARHRVDCRAQQGSDLRVRLREGIVENDQLIRFGAHAGTFEQHLADAPQDARAAGEPPGHIEGRRHRHAAGDVDASVRRAYAVDAAEGGRHPNRAAGIAAQREIAGAGGRRSGGAARGAARQSARGARIDRSAVMRVGAGDAEEKFVAHGLADDGGSSEQQLPDRRRVRERRPMRGKPIGVAATGAQLGDVIHVLHRRGQSGKRPLRGPGAGFGQIVRDERAAEMVSRRHAIAFRPALDTNRESWRRPTRRRRHGRESPRTRAAREQCDAERPTGRDDRRLP